MANRFGMDYSQNDGGGGGGGDFTPGSPSGENRRKPTDEQTLIPVTIKMLLTAATSNNTLEDGREPHYYKIVAAVREVTKSSTAYNYTVEDGTGCIDVKDWVDENNLAMSQMRDEAAVEHQYIRIIGQMKEYEGNIHLQAYSVKKISSGNEFTHHFLEVVHEAEKAKRAGQIVGSPSMGMGNMNFNPGSMNAAGNMNMQSSTPIGMNNNNNMSAGNDGLQGIIMEFLAKTVDIEVGRSVLEFIQQHQTYSESEIREKFNFLSTEGLIYSTVDENHYAAI